MTVGDNKLTQILTRNMARHPLRWLGQKLAKLADKDQHPKLAKVGKVAKWTAPVLTALAAGLFYDQSTCAPLFSELAWWTGAGFAGGAAVDGLVVLGVGRAAAREQLEGLQDVASLRLENKGLSEAYDGAMEKIEQLKQKHRQLLKAMQKQEEVDTGKLEKIDLERHYGIRNILGEGGYGKVLRGYDQQLKRPVVIKTLKDKLANDKEVVTRFVREARILASLDAHPNIARIYRVGKAQKDIAVYDIKAGTPCFIMEFVEGEDLHNYTTNRGGRLSVEESIKFAAKILRALKHAHENGIVHRDVKPENVMVIRDGQIKMIDFGIAKGGKVRSLTQNNQILGTPQYMSPEQMQGQKEEIDYRSDIYAVGVLLYELIEGINPFGDIGADPKELSAYIGRALRPNAVMDALGEARYIPEHLKEFFSGTMEADPNKRWVDHDDLIDFLEKQVAGMEPTAVGPHPLGAY